MLHARADYNHRIDDRDNIIPADEPVFLLRAQDSVAAETVRFWARLAEIEGADPNIVKLAREQAERMDQWHKHKVADL